MAVSITRSGLDETAFKTEYAQGRTMTLEQAAACALEHETEP